MKIKPEVILLIIGVVAAVSIVALVYSEFGGIPAPFGRRVAEVKIVVKGSWIHYGVPGFSDMVTIEDVDYYVVRWYNVLSLFSTYPTMGMGDTDDAKICYEIYDTSNNKVRSGEVYFKLQSGWMVTFNVKGLEPGVYNVRLTVYQKWTLFGLQSSWSSRCSKTVTITVNESE